MEFPRELRVIQGTSNPTNNPTGGICLMLANSRITLLGLSYISNLEADELHANGERKQIKHVPNTTGKYRNFGTFLK